MKKICKEIKKIIPNVEILFDVSLKDYHTYHIECIAKTLINVSREQDLIQLLKFLKDNSVNFFILGNGSNVIFKNKHRNHKDKQALNRNIEKYILSYLVFGVYSFVF